MTETARPSINATSSAAPGGSGDPRHQAHARVHDVARSVRGFRALAVEAATDIMEVVWICPQPTAV